MEAVALDLASGFDTLANGCAGFGGFDGGDFVGREGCNFDLQVDAVEEGPEILAR